jgi:hypothetical protein
MVSFLIRTAWDATMRGKGLYPYEMANGRKAWFPLAGYTDDGWIRYMGADGAERRKRLVGCSEKRKVYWHFAAEMLPLVGRELRIVLKPHVVFTRDGLATLASDHAMHRLRRGFCRNWWNPRWRDLLLAYTTMITDESGSITVAVGSEQALVVDPRPTLFSMPVSPLGLLEPITADDETDSQLEAWAADLDWEGYDEEEDRAEDPDQAGEGEEE